MSKIEYLECDLCKSQKEVKTMSLQVIFESDQTEGRFCPPYLSMEKVDVCNDCLNKITSEGKYVRGYGAQGFNKFYIPNK